MLIGLLVSIYLTVSPDRDPMKVIPAGVALVLLSSYLFSESSPSSGVNDLWPALLIRGIAVGILNVSLTVHIFRSFTWKNIPQGVAVFYIFRTLGSLIATALFSRLAYVETENADMLLRQSEALETSTGALSQWLTDSQSLFVLSAEVRHQALAIGVINGFRWFIFAVLIIIPVMILLLVWAKREHKL
jgi:DHA2 family multidrug resistance protein